MQIRPATDADLATLEAIAAAMGHRHEAGYFARCLAEQAAGRRLVLLAVEALGAGGLGYVQLNWQPAYPPFRRLDMPEVQDLCVVPDARRRGLGARLVQAAEDAARAAGKTAIGISVGLDASFGAAQRLYVRLGYVPDGAGVFYDDQPVRPGDMRAVDGYLTLKLSRRL